MNKYDLTNHKKINDNIRKCLAIKDIQINYPPGNNDVKMRVIKAINNNKIYDGYKTLWNSKIDKYGYK